MIIRVSRLCFLATQANDEPHISLMTFSYYTTPVEDVIVFTMRRDTKKYQQIVNNHKVNEYMPYNMRCGQGCCCWWWWSNSVVVPLSFDHRIDQVGMSVADDDDLLVSFLHIYLSFDSLIEKYYHDYLLYNRWQYWFMTSLIWI